MPKFMFHVPDGEPIIEGEAVELYGEAAAKIEGVRSAGASFAITAASFGTIPIGGCTLRVPFRRCGPPVKIAIASAERTERLGLVRG